jgi:anti-anti-sigma factor
MAGTPGKVTREEADGIVVLRASGKLDGAVGEEVVRLAADAAGALVLVLADVVYISSSGVAALVNLALRGNLRVVKAPDCVRAVLELAGVDQLFKLFDDEAAAVRGRA